MALWHRLEDLRLLLGLEHGVQRQNPHFFRRLVFTDLFELELLVQVVRAAIDNLHLLLLVLLLRGGGLVNVFVRVAVKVVVVRIAVVKVIRVPVVLSLIEAVERTDVRATLLPILPILLPPRSRPPPPPLAVESLAQLGAQVLHLALSREKHQHAAFGELAVDLTRLLVRRAQVVVQFRLPLEVHGHRILSRLHIDHRRRVLEELLILDEVVHPKRGAHDDQLERGHRRRRGILTAGRADAVLVHLTPEGDDPR